MITRGKMCCTQYITRWELCGGTSASRGLCDAGMLIDRRVHGFRWLAGGGFEFTQKSTSGAVREEDLQWEGGLRGLQERVQSRGSNLLPRGG